MDNEFANGKSTQTQIQTLKNKNEPEAEIELLKAELNQVKVNFDEITRVETFRDGAILKTG